MVLYIKILMVLEGSEPMEMTDLTNKIDDDRQTITDICRACSTSPTTRAFDE